MFICKNCGKVFDEPKIYVEKHGLSCPPYEHFAVCPHCNDTGITEGKQCMRCGEVVAELRDGLCDICYDDLEG